MISIFRVLRDKKRRVTTDIKAICSDAAELLITNSDKSIDDRSSIDLCNARSIFSGQHKAVILA